MSEAIVNHVYAKPATFQLPNLVQSHIDRAAVRPRTFDQPATDKMAKLSDHYQVSERLNPIDDAALAHIYGKPVKPLSGGAANLLDALNIGPNAYDRDASLEGHE